jgi:hypothetical protein
MAAEEKEEYYLFVFDTRFLYDIGCKGCQRAEMG